MRPVTSLLLLAVLAGTARADSVHPETRSAIGARSVVLVGESAAPSEKRAPGGDVDVPHPLTTAPLYYLNWWSVNGGGETNVNGTSFDLGVSVGQAAAGFASGTNFKLGVGFWYGAASAACPIALPGDVNLSTTITSADIIAVVNYVFKGGAAPMPCAANGDVNCSGTITSADIIALVNFVFKGGAAPCDICTIIPSLWSCP